MGSSPSTALLADSMLDQALPFSTTNPVTSVFDLHEGQLVLHFFSMADARELRLVSQELNRIITGYKWNDMVLWIKFRLFFTSRSRIIYIYALQVTLVKGPVALWRKSFPHAMAVNLSCNDYFCNTDLQFLAGVRAVDISQRRPSNAPERIYVSWLIRAAIARWIIHNST